MNDRQKNLLWRTISELNRTSEAIGMAETEINKLNHSNAQYHYYHTIIGILNDRHRNLWIECKDLVKDPQPDEEKETDEWVS